MTEYDDIINPIVNTFIQKKFTHLINREDYYQEAYLCLLEILNQEKSNFQSDKSSFKTYISKIIFNRLQSYTLINSSNLTASKNSMILAYKIKNLQNQGFEQSHICQELKITNKVYSELINIINNSIFATEKYNFLENLNLFIEELDLKLNNYEKTLMLIASKYKTYTEISKHLNKNYEHTRNDMKKLYDKIQGIIND